MYLIGSKLLSYNIVSMLQCRKVASCLINALTPESIPGTNFIPLRSGCKELFAVDQEFFDNLFI